MTNIHTLEMTDTLAHLHLLEGKITATVVVITPAILAILAICLVREDIVVVMTDLLTVIIATEAPILGITLTIEITTKERSFVIILSHPRPMQKKDKGMSLIDTTYTNLCGVCVRIQTGDL